MTGDGGSQEEGVFKSQLRGAEQRLGQADGLAILV